MKEFLVNLATLCYVIASLCSLGFMFVKDETISIIAAFIAVIMTAGLPSVVKWFGRNVGNDLNTPNHE